MEQDFSCCQLYGLLLQTYILLFQVLQEIVRYSSSCTIPLSLPLRTRINTTIFNCDKTLMEDQIFIISIVMAVWASGSGTGYSRTLCKWRIKQIIEKDAENGIDPLETDEIGAVGANNQNPARDLKGGAPWHGRDSPLSGRDAMLTTDTTEYSQNLRRILAHEYNSRMNTILRLSIGNVEIAKNFREN